MYYLFMGFAKWPNMSALFTARIEPFFDSGITEPQAQKYYFEHAKEMMTMMFT
jgi:hypothetical protein